MTFGADDFLQCLTEYLTTKHAFGGASPSSGDFYNVYKRFAILQKSTNGLDGRERKDVIQARPKQSANDKDAFDTVLVHESADADVVGINGAFIPSKLKKLCQYYD